jgi:aspartate racemase
MKTIGLIGGSTWVSTADYYKIINQLTNQLLGGSHSASILMYSLKFHEFRVLVEEGRTEEVKKLLISIAQNLEKAGAECLLICANTPHMFAEHIQAGIKIPLIHIAEETAKEIRLQQLKKVALLGTKPTMEQSFYKDKLAQYGIQTIIPDDTDREMINDTIFNEFSKEIFSDETRRKYMAVIEKLRSLGAEGVILGCTEIPLLIKQKDSSIPVFDTMSIHCHAAVKFANN